MRKFAVIILSLIMTAVLLSGCAQSEDTSSNGDNHITVYLWEDILFDEFENYVEEQCPDVEVEFIVGNNNVFLYDYLEKHGDLPDIIITRRFSAADAKRLSPYLIDMSSYDVVSSFYPYALQYYTNADGQIQWLPICGIPETMFVNKTLFDQYGISIPENYEQLVEACDKLESNGIKPFAKAFHGEMRRKVQKMRFCLMINSGQAFSVR